MNSKDQTETGKAIIIGCGIAGPAMAIFLKKIGIQTTIFEAQPEDRDNEGVFLGISPNGLNVIKEFMPLDNLLDDHTPGKMAFYNAKGKNIGTIDTAWQKELYGCELIQLKRGLLNKAVREEAVRHGIKIEFNKKLKAITQSRGRVTARFEDGSSAVGHFLIGADGIHSTCRRLLFPDAPKITYTGQVGSGGYARLKDTRELNGQIHMIFGEKAFFGYAVSNRNEIWWFNNIFQDREPNRYDHPGMDQTALKNMLLDLHRNDPAPVAEIIQATSPISCYPMYDIPFLDKWHSGCVCLIGDAAHATAPHIGQGASLALEDTIVLTKCLRDLPSVQQAFQKFQSIRQHRVQKIIHTARKTGNKKTAPNKLQLIIRDLLLPIFIKSQTKKMSWIYGYNVVWDDLIEP